MERTFHPFIKLGIQTMFAPDDRVRDRSGNSEPWQKYRLAKEAASAYTKSGINGLGFSYVEVDIFGNLVDALFMRDHPFGTKPFVYEDAVELVKKFTLGKKFSEADFEKLQRLAELTYKQQQADTVNDPNRKLPDPIELTKMRAGVLKIIRPPKTVVVPTLPRVEAVIPAISFGPKDALGTDEYEGETVIWLRKPRIGLSNENILRSTAGYLVGVRDRLVQARLGTRTQVLDTEKAISAMMVGNAYPPRVLTEAGIGIDLLFKTATATVNYLNKKHNA